MLLLLGPWQVLATIENNTYNSCSDLFVRIIFLSSKLSFIILDTNYTKCFNHVIVFERALLVLCSASTGCPFSFAHVTFTTVFFLVVMNHVYSAHTLLRAAGIARNAIGSHLGYFHKVKLFSTLSRTLSQPLSLDLCTV